MIVWKDKQDMFVEGIAADIRLYIITNKDNKVTGLYLIRADDKVKHVPSDKHELEIDCMKMRAEELIKYYTK